MNTFHALMMDAFAKTAAYNGSLFLLVERGDSDRDRFVPVGSMERVCCTAISDWNENKKSLTVEVAFYFRSNVIKDIVRMRWESLMESLWEGRDDRLF